MKNKIFYTFLLIMSISLLPAGCGLNNNQKVSIFYNDSEKDEYTETIRTNLDKQLKENNIVYESFTAGSNQKLQTEQIEKEVRGGAGILVVNMADNLSDEETENVVNIAAKADIPLVFFGRPVDEKILEDYSKSVYIGADHSEAQKVQGRMIGNYLLDNYELVDLNGDGKISYVIYADKHNETNADTHPNVEEADRILSAEGKPALEYYNPLQSPLYYTTEDNLNIYNHMSQILTEYNDNNGNMIELVIAERDEWALCALEALKDVGYNQVRGTKIIPLFGIGATVAAQNALYGGMMSGTVHQDSDQMAEIIKKVCHNMLKNKDKFQGIDDNIVKGKNRIKIPYEEYYGRNTM